LGLILVFIFFSISSFAQPASAMLDVSAPNKGILIPRVSLTSSLDISTVPSPVTSLLVYNTSTRVLIQAMFLLISTFGLVLNGNL
jgi:hypothetical protein